MFSCCRFALHPAWSNTRVSALMFHADEVLGSKLRVYPPDGLAGVQVRLLAAAAKGHVVVAQGVSGPREPLAQTLKALVHFKHAAVQQLVEDGCRAQNTANRLTLTYELLNISGHTSDTHTGTCRRS